MHFCASVFNTQLDADLAQAGWDGQLKPYPGITRRQFTFQHLKRSVLKKYVSSLQGTTPAGDAAAIKKFLAANEKCRTWAPDFSNLNEAETEIVGEVKAIIYDFFNPNGLPLLSLGAIAKGFNCGPGASLGAKGEDFYTKFSTSTLTATSEALLQYYQCSVRNHRLWGAQELQRQRLRGYRTVSGNKLSCVAKYSDISRVICTEPSLNMIFQKGIERLLCERLAQVFGIDLVTQQFINRRLARVGARYGWFATADLESASDLVSRLLCAWSIPPEAFRWFDLVRSPSTILPDGTKVDLHMISSMGNATTFPLQTMFFAAIVLAVYRVLGIRVKKRDRRTYRFTPCNNIRDYRRSLPNFAVNGDDIICRTEAYGLVTKMLVWFGFKVNETKSFFEGDFRESCGADFFGSTNVRGVYLKRMYDVCDVFSAINRLNSWSAEHRVALPRSVGYLLTLVGSKKQFVPLGEAVSAGIQVPYQTARPKLDRNRTAMYRYWRVKELKVTLGQLTRRGKSSKYEGPEERLAVIRQVLPSFFVNEEGLVNALLAGSICASQISKRQHRRRLELRKLHSPCWDYTSDRDAVRRRYFVRWKAYVELNLGLLEE